MRPVIYMSICRKPNIYRRFVESVSNHSIPTLRLDHLYWHTAPLEMLVSELLGENGTLVAQAAEKYGSRGARQAQDLMSEVTGLFAGGELAEEDLDVMMKAITEAYWIAKEKNKKFAPKKRKKQG